MNTIHRKERRETRRQMIEEMKKEKEANPQFRKGRRFALAYVYFWAATVYITQTIIFFTRLHPYYGTTFDNTNWFGVIGYTVIYFGFAILISIAVYCLKVLNNAQLAALAMMMSSILYLTSASERLTPGVALYFFLAMLGCLLFFQKSIKVYQARADEIAHQYGFESKMPRFQK